MFTETGFNRKQERDLSPGRGRMFKNWANSISLICTTFIFYVAVKKQIN
jgi:hypothetical protein